MNNASLTVQTDVVNKEHFSYYSRTYATHSVQDVKWYKIPSGVNEISVMSCQGKG